MTLPLWATELAREFWQMGEPAESFPRSLRQSLARALPLGVVLLPDLCLEAVCSWLRQHALTCPCAGMDRTLRACLFASRGAGFIFLDGTDSEDEQRFSLAHELAHFLRDYWQPRQLACQQLGAQIVEVLDGVRPPTAAERLHALLRRVPLGCHYHLMERDKRRCFATEEVAVAEEEADLLAYELLAPAEIVFARIGPILQGPELRQHLAQILREVFGLPASRAYAYSSLLIPETPANPLVERLRHQS
jgi:hypothetical protein